MPKAPRTVLSAENFNEGIAIYLMAPGKLGFANEFINEGRTYSLENGQLRIYDGNGKLLRLLNWDHVAIVCPLKTVGPAAKQPEA